MIKILLCVLLVLFSTFVAYLLTKKFKVKRDFYYDFYLFNDRLINEVSFIKTPLIDFCKKYDYGSDFTKVIDRFLNEDELNLFDNNRLLKKEEKKFIEDYFSMLGKSDAMSQKNYLLSTKQEIENTKQMAERDCTRYCSLYLKLGFLFGLFLIILIY